MKTKRLFCIILVLTLIFGIFNFSVLAGETEETALKVLPYGQMKFVKSTGILSGISSKTDVETVFNVPEGTKKMRVFVANWETGKKVYADNIKLAKIN